MFIENKYYTVYQSIVMNAKQRPHIAVPFEQHHIVPRSMGGPDTEDNIVKLTLKEHFVCHHLLTKCTTGYKMKHAYGQMVHCGKYTASARQYETARALYAEGGRSVEWRANISKAAKGRKKTPEQVAAMRIRLTGRQLTTEHKQNISKARKGIPLTQECRDARMKTLIKPFKVTRPDGTTVEGVNLKQYAIDNGFNHPTVANNIKTNKAISRGPHKGYNFERIVDYTND